jgi:hypothetical protein
MLELTSVCHRISSCCGHRVFASASSFKVGNAIASSEASCCKNLLFSTTSFMLSSCATGLEKNCCCASAALVIFTTRSSTMNLQQHRKKKLEKAAAPRIAIAAAANFFTLNVSFCQLLFVCEKAKLACERQAFQENIPNLRTTAKK